MTLLNWICDVTRDAVVAPIAEAIYVLFCLGAMIQDWRMRRQSGMFKANVIRGETSMKKLHGTYGALVFVILLLTLNVRVIEDRRIIFVILNLGLLAYLVFFNIWFRNKMLHYINWSANIEDEG